jgi:N-acetyl-anhydromuramyl-L-alanine amidase AmpD
MLTIHAVEQLDNKKLNIVKKKSKKTQIFLYDTQRRTDDFINKIKYRRNGKYDDIPHFIVTKLGVVYQLFDTKYSSNTFYDEKMDSRMIKIAVENLGWLNKNTINGVLNNWIDDPYRSEPYIKNWRNHYFWDRYTDIQLSAVSELCEKLCEDHNIFKQVVPSQGYIENVTIFKGVVCKSNFSSIYTDINPSFNFRILFNNAKETEKQL